MKSIRLAERGAGITRMRLLHGAFQSLPEVSSPFDRMAQMN
jgi:hypothetical protein